MSEKTVAAISTPAGEGGIGVIRISGKDAINIADKVFKSANNIPLAKLSGYSAAFGYVYDNNELIDEAVATVFLEPKSYTGENVCEISCHGGQFITSAVLRSVLAAGAEMAAPGEFTKRAFVNDKISLTEAEAIGNLLTAEGERAVRLSARHADGALKKKTEEI